MSKLQFIENINAEILPHESSNIRIMTYNVHGFKNRQNEKKLDEIINIIVKINPQILIIQEVFVFVKSQTIVQNDLMNILRSKGYEYITFSKNGSNLVCSIHNFFCRELDLGKDDIKKISRNALICSFPDLNDLIVIGTHLDVFDDTGKTRIKQIIKIINELEISENHNKSCIISGDLNSLRKTDYNDLEWNNLVTTDLKRNVITVEDVIPIIENSGFVDSFFSCSKSLKVSVWSGRRVDYIFGKNIIFVRTAPYEITMSDHFPIYADFII